jgi:hypothetical protein
VIFYCTVSDFYDQIMAASVTSAAVRHVYRELVHLAKQRQKSSDLQEIRTKFRHPILENESVETRLKQAQDRVSFLRISSVKVKPRGQSGRWVYRNGERLENAEGTLRDATGRVLSPYDGKNLDPESVTRHRSSLKRAGFVNNSHAKGIF